MISIFAPARAAASHACQSRARFSRRSRASSSRPRRLEAGGIGALAAEELHARRTRRGPRPARPRRPRGARARPGPGPGRARGRRAARPARTAPPRRRSRRPGARARAGPRPSAPPPRASRAWPFASSSAFCRRTARSTSGAGLVERQKAGGLDADEPEDDVALRARARGRSRRRAAARRSASLASGDPRRRPRSGRPRRSGPASRTVRPSFARLRREVARDQERPLGLLRPVPVGLQLPLGGERRAEGGRDLLQLLPRARHDLEHLEDVEAEGAPDGPADLARP